MPAMDEEEGRPAAAEPIADESDTRREALKRVGLAAAGLAAASLLPFGSSAHGASLPTGMADDEDFEERVVMRAFKDDAFRKRLLADPRRAVAEVLGKDFPAGIDIKVVQESPTTVYLVLPAAEPATRVRPGGTGAPGLPFHSRWRCCNHDLTCTRKGRPAG